MKKQIIIILLSLLSILLLHAQPIKVACVGNSVTYGAGIEETSLRYPAQLQQMLRKNYKVRNFGHNGATLLRKGHNPYWKLPEMEKALAFQPDIVIIHLGLNDTDPRNWPRHRDDFTKDYLQLIDTFRQCNPKARIHICRMTPIFTAHPRFASSTRDWHAQIQEEIGRVAQSADVSIIDLYAPLHNRPDLFADALHPNGEGANIIAQTVYSAITGDYGGLKLPKIFTNHMVVQRDKPIIFWGTANAGTSVTVQFAGKTFHTQAANDGKWEVEFPKMKAGTNYLAIVQNEKTTIRLEDICIGEVWICSGQSNMAFPLKDATTWNDEKAFVENDKLRFFHMEAIAPTASCAWNSTTLSAVNRLQYMQSAGWTTSDSISAMKFSAVAYYFGKMLQQQLNVPVGLILNAVGGTPAEAWIDRTTMENNSLFVNFFRDWHKSDFIDGWVRQRATQNIEKASNKAIQQHPYKPSYMYACAMKPYENYPISGVIWYQGESNANNVELHEKLFPTLVQSWRHARDNCFPFYYVQLSSMDVGRETWGLFRDSQRRLMQRVPHSGMAVSSDVGDRADVHPRQKKEVGERLARWALDDTYGINLRKSGPLFASATFYDKVAVVQFSEADELTTSDEKPIAGFEIAGKDKIFYPATGIVKGTNVKVYSDRVLQPAFVRYGWNSYSDGNLVNEELLPASTFSTEFEER